jgi:hypothetical protein
MTQVSDVGSSQASIPGDADGNVALSSFCAKICGSGDFMSECMALHAEDSGIQLQVNRQGAQLQQRAVREARHKRRELIKKIREAQEDSGFWSGLTDFFSGLTSLVTTALLVFSGPAGTAGLIGAIASGGCGLLKAHYDSNAALAQANKFQVEQFKQDAVDLRDEQVGEMERVVQMEGVSSMPIGGEHDQSEVFLEKFASVTGIESLILEDVRLQRKTASMLRKAQRELRRKLVKAAVKKMKEAANARFGSALLGIGLKIGAAAFDAVYGDTLEKTLGEIPGKITRKGVQALADGFAKYNPLDTYATELDGEAKLLEDSADGQRDAANDTSDWLAGVRELERRVIDHLENMNAIKHKTALTATGN